MSADPRPALIGFMPDPEQQRCLVRESVQARQPDAQRWSLTPPAPIDRPVIRPVPAAHQDGFYSATGG